MGYQLLLGDCIEVLRELPSGSVQMCCTSPPYYSLRDYGHNGQIGTEETPEAYVAKLVAVFDEVRRVLHPTGVLFLNLGDSYAGSNKGVMGDGSLVGGPKQRTNKGSMLGAIHKTPTFGGIKPKDLIGIPWMVAFALRADGWWLRSEIIWAKPNPMPESVRDRPTKSHEQIFLLSKSRVYYYDHVAVMEPNSRDWAGSTGKMHANGSDHLTGLARGGTSQNGLFTSVPSPAGRNRRSVWTVTPKPYKGAHFATFPPDLIEPCILAGTSEHGCCAACGSPWARVVERKAATPGRNNNSLAHPEQLRQDGDRCGGWVDMRSTTTGWAATCACDANVVPCTVLDPFSGSATTGVVALKYGREYIGIDLNPDYMQLAHERIARSQPLLLRERV